jgi:hypothetical protein
MLAAVMTIGSSIGLCEVLGTLEVQYSTAQQRTALDGSLLSCTAADLTSQTYSTVLLTSWKRTSAGTNLTGLTKQTWHDMHSECPSSVIATQDSIQSSLFNGGVGPWAQDFKHSTVSSLQWLLLVGQDKEECSSSYAIVQT